MALSAMKTYLAQTNQYYSQTEKAERWVLTHAIRRTVWDADPWDVTTVPAKGDAAPVGGDAYPVGMGVEGVCQDRSLDVFTEPGWALLTLVYGWDVTSIGINKAYVTGRSVIFQLPIPDTVDGTLVRGPVLDADGKITTQFKDITPGYATQYELCCQMIRLHAFVDETVLIATAGALQHLGGSLNSDAWIILGKSHGVNTMMYRGCEFDVYRHSNVDDDRVYVARFDFLVHPIIWPLNVRTTLWEYIVQQTNYYDSATAVIGKRGIMGRKQITSAATDYPFRITHNFATELAPLIS